LQVFFFHHIKGVLSQIGENCGDNWGLEADQKGLIQTSFVICYFASAPIFGFLGDRYSRKWLMAIGVLAWGTCTLISSFMKVLLQAIFRLLFSFFVIFYVTGKQGDDFSQNI
jgi:MFS family permease